MVNRISLSGLSLIGLLMPTMLLTPSAFAESVKGFPFDHHLNQADVLELPAAEVVRLGRAIFEAEYTKQDGVGANLALDEDVTIRYTRMPRMDLPGFAANPTRISGPNAQSCLACHNVPFAAGAGDVADNEIRDPHRTGDPAQYIQRNPLPLFGSGALQLLAEQVTRELASVKTDALRQAATLQQPVSVELVTSNGVNYGKLTVSPEGDVDVREIKGIDSDLILRPYLWKGGFVTFLRPLVGLGMDLELGIQAEEAVADMDFDFDGVTNELSGGDVTAATAYVATLPRPVTQLELSEYLAGEFRLSLFEKKTIERGESLFNAVGCADCHKPALQLLDPVFRDPSPNPAHRFPLLLTGMDPVQVGLDPKNPLAIDLAMNPQIGRVKNDKYCRSGRKFAAQQQFCFLQYETAKGGGLTIRLYGDLKRHDMGPGLAESVDDIGTGKSVWKTRELWGVGSTGPWLHDGRASTLEEAILWHGGDSQYSRDAYASLPEVKRQSIVRFLQNLILFRPKYHKS